jgi:hypothetical protein
MEGYFENSGQFTRAWNKFYQDLVTKYPILALRPELLTPDEIGEIIDISPIIVKDRFALFERLPPDRKPPKNPNIPRPVGRAATPWRYNPNDGLISGGIDYEESLRYFNYRRSIVKRTCLVCGKFELYQPEYPQSVIDFLKSRDPLFPNKFKYQCYCSDNCYNLARDKKRCKRNEARRKQRITLTCPYCKKDYQTRSSKPAQSCRKSACKKRLQRVKKGLAKQPAFS